MRLPILTGAAVLGLAAFASGPAIAADALTVVSWGGAFTKRQAFRT